MSPTSERLAANVPRSAYSKCGQKVQLEKARWRTYQCWGTPHTCKRVDDRRVHSTQDSEEASRSFAVRVPCSFRKPVSWVQQTGRWSLLDHDQSPCTGAMIVCSVEGSMVSKSLRVGTKVSVAVILPKVPHIYTVQTTQYLRWCFLAQGGTFPALVVMPSSGLAQREDAPATRSHFGQHSEDSPPAYRRG